MPKSDIRVQVKSISSVDSIKDLFEEVGVTMIVQVVVLQNRAEVISDRCFKEISQNHHVSQGEFVVIFQIHGVSKTLLIHLMGQLVMILMVDCKLSHSIIDC